MKNAFTVLLLSGILAVGCRSHVIQVSITNSGTNTIRNVEVQYPGGSYGIAVLNPGYSHQYRIKPFSAATMQISYEDSAGKQHVKSGPRVEKGQEGTLVVTMNGSDLQYKIDVR